MNEGVDGTEEDQICSTCLQIQLVVSAWFQAVVVQAPEPLTRQAEVTELR